MARGFNGSSQAASATLDLSAFNKITFAFWLWWNAFANDDELALEYSTNYNNNAGTFIVDPNDAGGNFRFGCEIDGTGSLSNSFADITRPSAAVWHHYMVTMDGAVSFPTDPITAVYLDGVSQSLTTGVGASVLPGSFGNYTLYFMSRAGTSLFGAGRMADLAFWGGVLLTAGEAAALGKGARPYTIRPLSLVGWWPLDGLVSPEPDLSGNAKNATLIASPPVIGGPPVAMFTPRWPQFLTPPAAAASGSLVFSQQLITIPLSIPITATVKVGS